MRLTKRTEHITGVATKGCLMTDSHTEYPLPIEVTFNCLSDSKWSVSHLHGAVYRYCLSLTKSSIEAEDLVQDTWVKVLDGNKYRSHINPEALMLRTAKNTWIDRVRRKQVLNRLMDQVIPCEGVLDESCLEADTALQAIFKHLPPLQRTVFMLRDVFGYTIAETAQWLETTEGAVKAAHHRARQSLEAVKRELEQDVIAIPDGAVNEQNNTLSAFIAAYRLEDALAIVKLYRSELAIQDAMPDQARQRSRHMVHRYTSPYSLMSKAA